MKKTNLIFLKTFHKFHLEELFCFYINIHKTKQIRLIILFNIQLSRFTCLFCVNEFLNSSTQRFSVEDNLYLLMTDTI